MKTSKIEMELFKKLKKFDESCSFTKATRMSSAYLIGFAKNILNQPFRFATHGYSINLNIKFTVKKKKSLSCSKKEKFLKLFLSYI